MEIFFHIQKAVVTCLLGCRIRLTRAESVIAACVSSQSIFLVGSSFGRRSRANLGILKSSGLFSDMIALNGFDV